MPSPSQLSGIFPTFAAMKRIPWIGLLVLLALAACDTTTRDARRMVKRAERLADTLPDSTVSLIDSVLRMPASFSERERMDMALLQAEAMFGPIGNTIHRFSDSDEILSNHAMEFVVTSPDLERASNYYAKKRDYSKASLAALFSGYVQMDAFEKTAAMQSFMEAEHFGGLIGDSIIMAYAQYNMGRMLHNDDALNEAIVMLQKSDYNIGQLYADRAFIQNMLAVSYMALNDFDNSEICLEKSLEYAEKGNSIEAKKKILNNYSVFNRLQGNYSQSIYYLRRLENENDSVNKPLLYLNFGKTFFAKGEMDSAAFYFQQLGDVLNKSSIKLEILFSIYKTLSRFCESQGDYASALRYERLCLNSLEKLNLRKQNSAYKIQRKYDYEAKQNSMNQKLIRTHYIIATVIVLFLGIMTLFFYRLAQRNKKEAEANANLFHFMQQNKALVESNMEHERKALDMSQQLSDMLYARLSAMLKFDYCLKNPKDKIALKDIEKEVFGDGDHWEAIKEVLIALYPGLWESLKLKYPEMDEMERRVFMLSRLKLSRLGEATLLGISTSVLDKLRTKVHRIVEEGKK